MAVLVPTKVPDRERVVDLGRQRCRIRRRRHGWCSRGRQHRGRCRRRRHGGRCRRRRPAPARVGGATGGGAAAAGVQPCGDRERPGPRRPVLAALHRLQRRQRRRAPPGRHRQRDPGRLPGAQREGLPADARRARRRHPLGHPRRRHAAPSRRSPTTSTSASSSTAARSRSTSTTAGLEHQRAARQGP